MTIAPVLQPRELEELMAARADVRLLDVRTPGEFENAHISGAYNVPLDALSEHAAEIADDVLTEFILICQSGARARKAEEDLQASGLARLHVLDGGMNAWLAAGKPVRLGAKRMSLERQVRIMAGALGALGGLLALLVHPWFALVPLLIGGGLVFAGATDTCAMGTLLARLPYNATVTCDVPAMVQALRHGAEPVPLRRRTRAGQSCAK